MNGYEPYATLWPYVPSGAETTNEDDVQCHS